MKEIKFRQVYKNLKTGELVFIYFCISETGQTLIANPDDWEKILNWACETPQRWTPQPWELIGQDLYILDDSDGNPIYENDIVETYWKEDGKKKEKVLISQDLEYHYVPGVGNFYGWNFQEADINDFFFTFRKITSKYESRSDE